MAEKTPAFRARLLETTFRRLIAAQMGSQESIKTYLEPVLQGAASSSGLSALKEVLDDRFVDMLYSEEDVARWQDMLVHESRRDRFRTDRAELAKLAEEIGHWWDWLRDTRADVHNFDRVVREIEQGLRQNEQPRLDTVERQRIGRRALREALLRMHREKRL